MPWSSAFECVRFWCHLVWFSFMDIFTQSKASLHEKLLCPACKCSTGWVWCVVVSCTVAILWHCVSGICRLHKSWTHHITVESRGCVLWNRSEQLSQWDSPMRVKLSIWKPYVRTLLIELLPWALLINQSKWDLWLFEGEKIVLQVPAGKIIIPPNFQVI